MRRCSILCVLASALLTCSDQGSDSATHSGAPKPSATKRKVAQAGLAIDAPESPASRDADSNSERAAGLLEAVPADAWLVTRWPSFRAADDAWRDSALVKGLERAGMSAVAQAVVDPVATFAAAMKPAMSSTEKPWLDAVTALRGDLVVALIDVDPTVMTPSGPASTWLVLAALDGHADDWVALLDRASSGRGKIGKCTRIAAGQYAISEGADHAEVRVRDDRLEVVLGVGAPGRSLDDALARNAESSFATSPAHTALPHAAGMPWLEIHANAAPLLRLVRELEGPAAASSLTALGLDGVIGISASFALDGALLRNQFALASTGRRDVFSACFREDVLDPSFARLAPADADTAVLCGFDLAAALDAVRSRLPAAGRTGLDSALAEIENDSGLDVRTAILENFGPNVLFTSRGNLAHAMSRSDVYDAALAIQVRNEAAAQSILGMAFEANPAAFKARSAGDLRYVSIGLPVPELAWLDLSFGIHDGLLVVATSGEMLEEIFANAKTTDVRCAPLSTALAAAAPGTFYVSTADTRAELESLLEFARMGSLDTPGASVVPFELPTPEQLRDFCMGLGHATATMRATQDGVVYESAGPVNLPIQGAPTLAIVGSIAIPKLLAARVEANEAAAVATLRNVCSAQAQFQAIGVKDRDSDGMGEFGSFAELTGKLALPDGSVLDPPVLSKSLADIESGCVIRNGYVFACILPGKNGQPMPESDRGGAGQNVDADLAELYFTIYAWPVDAGTTGVRAFAIDQSGDIYATYSMGFDPPVSGLESPPPLDDAFDFDARFQASQQGRLEFFWEPVH
jgi:hypothetical protein